nr:DMT family transporter [Pontivivens insulae]
MRLILTILIVLIAFAANSVLTRAGLVAGGIGPGDFTAIRLVSGAGMLAILVALQGGRPWEGGSLAGTGSLFVYAAAFSTAYIVMDAGLGALVLFGAVQVTMFAGAIMQGERPGLWRWVGSALGLAGLALLGVPGADAPPVWALALMIGSGVAWGLYSLVGARSGPPLRATAANFLWAAPLGLLFAVIMVEDVPQAAGIALAVASGAVTSGLGYALWYRVLPRLEATQAALAQLTVPLIALAGGMVFLGEPATLRFALSAVLILGGVALGLLLGRKKLPDGD